MEYQCISADCHIDLNWFPDDFFVSNASQAMKERMPYVVQKGEDRKWVVKSGIDLGYANGHGTPGAMASGYKYIPGEVHRADRMASTGLYSDGSKGIYRPTTPELRLQDQDRDGIQAEVIYGLHGPGYKMDDKEATIEFYRIYNDWLSNFCRYDLRRFIGLGVIPCHRVEAAVAEAKRIAKLGGFGGIEFLASYDMIPLWNPYWDPLWEAATEINLPVHFHTIGPGPVAPLPADLPQETYKQVAFATRIAGAPFSIISILASIIYGGALEKHPTLRIVLGEAGIGWIPYTLDRMDYEYEDRFEGRIPLKMKPSEYWRRQCKATFQNDRIGGLLLEEMGVETVMWGSDYPHGDGVFPDSQEYIKRQFGHLPKEVQHKIVCGNAVELYRLVN